jgi:hypothetical protein
MGRCEFIRTSARTVRINSHRPPNHHSAFRTTPYRQTLKSAQKDSQFGAGLALSGERLIVGAPQEKRNVNQCNRSGSVHAYRLTGKRWSEDAEFPLPDSREHWSGQLGAELTLRAARPRKRIGRGLSANTPTDALRKLSTSYELSLKGWGNDGNRAISLCISHSLSS